MARILAILVLFFAGCQSSKKQPAPILQINVGAEPQSLNPHHVNDVASVSLVKMFFEGLMRIGPGDTPQLALAEAVEISLDLKTYTFHLRPSVWTSGEKVTAQDFARSWKEVLSPEFSGQSAAALYVIKNGAPVKKGELSPDSLGIEIIDEKTLIVHLENPAPYFLELLASPIFFPLPQDWEEGIGNGPFRLRKWQHHHQIIAEKNPLYWDCSAVKMERISVSMLPANTELLLFETGELHWAGSPLSTLPVDSLGDLNRKYTVYKKGIAGTDFIRFNVNVIKAGAVRTALSKAIDREAIAEEVVAGQRAATSYIPPCLHGRGSFFDEKGALPEDIPTYTLLHVNSERRHLMAQAMQEMWRKRLGIQVKLEAVERKVFFSRLAQGDYEMAQSSWLADYSDPVNFLEIFAVPNNTGWQDPEFTELIKQSYATGNPEKREDLLVRSEKILLDAAPIAPLFHYNMMYIKDPRLEGVFLSSMGLLDFKWACWKDE